MIKKPVPIIGCTIGDLGGIGPEVLFKALKKFPNNNCIIIVLGSFPAVKALNLEKTLESLDMEITNDIYASPLDVGKVYFYDIPGFELPINIGRPDAKNGLLSYIYIKEGIKLALEKKIKALVTAPICKQSLSLANISYTGHTTILKEMTNSSPVSMAFYSERLKTILVTIHQPLSAVPKLISSRKLEDTIENTFLYARLLGLRFPRIAIAGLNPHAGEHGLFGNEEEEIIYPVLNKYKAKGKEIIGPLPPDTIYYEAVNGKYDIVISLYHDQGLIPLKLLSFDEAVNITLGLPFIRTSPDHGTAFNIAGKNIASSNSMLEALKLARRFIK